MKTVSGWRCPDLLTGPGNYLRKTSDAALALANTRARRTAVQAGGHIGTWPVMLAAEFSAVITFEPDWNNFSALVQNLEERTTGNVFPVRGILGQKRRPHGFHRSQKSTGQHYVGSGESVPCFRIDDLGLENCDAIFLDVEGFEIPALRGAVRTIELCGPVIMVEENKRCVTQGFRLGQLEAELAALGYVILDRIGEDVVFVHETNERKVAP